MNDHIKRLEAKGLTDLQICTILSGWSRDSIEALLRGETEPPSHEGIVEAVNAFGYFD
jgi:hypothetical protein